MKNVLPVLSMLFIFANCSTSSSIQPLVMMGAVSRGVTVMSEIVDRTAQCSGSVVSTGVVLTAAHCRGETMTVDGKIAFVIQADEAMDLLLLRVDTREFPPIGFNTSPSAGDRVFTVASLDKYPSMVGIGSIVRVLPDAIFAQGVLQGPGFSGSALYDSAGRLVGMNNQYYNSRLPTGDAHVTFGSAVTAAMVRDFMRKANV